MQEAQGSIRLFGAVVGHSNMDRLGQLFPAPLLVMARFHPLSICSVPVTAAHHKESLTQQHFTVAPPGNIFLQPKEQLSIGEGISPGNLDLESGPSILV